jgi:dTDP-4-amino-4,6-dideoxygalactose transaminase
VTKHVPFNSPHTDGSELAAIAAAIENHHLAGNGPFTKRCQHWLESNLGVPKALLTQ